MTFAPLIFSVTTIPCTSNLRTTLLPSEVGVNLAAAKVASATFRPARVKGGVSGLGFTSFNFISQVQSISRLVSAL